MAAARVAELAGERGGLVVEERLAGDATGSDARRRDGSWTLSPPRAAGGLADALRRDATGGARRPGPGRVAARPRDRHLAPGATLPPGWVAVARDGSAVVDDVGVTLGSPDSVLERRAEKARLEAELERADSELAASRAAAETSASAATEARTALDGTRAEEAKLVAERRRAERPSAWWRANPRRSPGKWRGTRPNGRAWMVNWHVFGNCLGR